MNQPGLFTIIIDNYNYALFLKQAIDSALSQTYPHTEVIVVDDGSTDNSRDVIESFGNRILPVFKDNEGQASAFNVGYQKSKGDMVLFLDADDILLPTAATRAAEAFSDPNVSKVQWQQYVIDKDGIRTGVLRPDRDLPEGDLRAYTVENGPLSHRITPTSGNAWSRQFLQQVMPIRENGDRHGADGYLLCLASVLGLIKTIREPQGCYRVHQQNFNSDDCHGRTSRLLRRYRFYAQLISEQLHKLGIPFDAENWQRPGSMYAKLQAIQSLPEIIGKFIPLGGTYILVDEGQLDSNWLKGRRALPFVEHNGEYWGAPEDNATAISELNRLRVLGATHIVFTPETLWWLDYYSGFRQHLMDGFVCELMNDTVAVFDLTRST